VREKINKIDPTSMPAAYPIIGMNLSSSQMELVESWGLGHSNQAWAGLLQACLRAQPSVSTVQ